MKISDIDKARDIINFLKSTEDSIKRLETSENFYISSDKESVIVKGKKIISPKLFIQMKHIAKTQLQKDRQTALRGLAKLGVEV